MSEFNIEVKGGSSVRLPTAGKYCDRDIVVTATDNSEEWKYAIERSATPFAMPDSVTSIGDYAFLLLHRFKINFTFQKANKYW